MAFIINPNQLLFVYFEKNYTLQVKKNNTYASFVQDTFYARRGVLLLFMQSNLIICCHLNTLITSTQNGPSILSLKTVTRKNENWIRINKSKYQTLLSYVNWNYAFKSTVGLCYRGSIVCQYFKKPCWGFFMFKKMIYQWLKIFN